MKSDRQLSERQSRGHLPHEKEAIPSSIPINKPKSDRSIERQSKQIKRQALAQSKGKLITSRAVSPPNRSIKHESTPVRQLGKMAESKYTAFPIVGTAAILGPTHHRQRPGSGSPPRAETDSRRSAVVRVHSPAIASQPVLLPGHITTTQTITIPQVVSTQSIQVSPTILHSQQILTPPLISSNVIIGTQSTPNPNVYQSQMNLATSTRTEQIISQKEEIVRRYRQTLQDRQGRLKNYEARLSNMQQKLQDHDLQRKANVILTNYFMELSRLFSNQQLSLQQLRSFIIKLIEDNTKLRQQIQQLQLQYRERQQHLTEELERLINKNTQTAFQNNKVELSTYELTRELNERNRQIDLLKARLREVVEVDKSASNLSKGELDLEVKKLRSINVGLESQLHLLRTRVTQAEISPSSEKYQKNGSYKNLFEQNFESENNTLRAKIMSLEVKLQSRNQQIVALGQRLHTMEEQKQGAHYGRGNDSLSYSLEGGIDRLDINQSNIRRVREEENTNSSALRLINSLAREEEPSSQTHSSRLSGQRHKPSQFQNQTNGGKPQAISIIQEGHRPQSHYNLLPPNQLQPIHQNSSRTDQPSTLHDRQKVLLATAQQLRQRIIELENENSYTMERLKAQISSSGDKEELSRKNEELKEAKLKLQLHIIELEKDAAETETKIREMWQMHKRQVEQERQKGRVLLENSKQKEMILRVRIDQLSQIVGRLQNEEILEQNPQELKPQLSQNKQRSITVEASSRYTQMQAQISKLQQFKVKCGELQDQIERILQTNEELRKQMISKQSELSIFKQQLESLTAAKRLIEQELVRKGRNNSINLPTTEALQLNSSVRGANRLSEEGDKQELLKSYRQQLSGLTERVNLLTVENTRLRSIEQTNKIDIETMRRHLGQTGSQIDSLIKELEEARAQGLKVTQLQLELEELKSGEVKKKLEMSKRRQSYISPNDRNSIVQEEDAQPINELQKEFLKEQTIRQNLEQDIQVLTEQLKFAQKQIVNRQSNEEKLKDQLRETVDRLQRECQIYKESAQSITPLAEENNKLKKQLSELKYQKSESNLQLFASHQDQQRQLLSSQNINRQKLEATIRRLQQQKHLLEEKLNSAAQQMDILREAEGNFHAAQADFVNKQGSISKSQQEKAKILMKQLEDVQNESMRLKQNESSWQQNMSEIAEASRRNLQSSNRQQQELVIRLQAKQQEASIFRQKFEQAEKIRSQLQSQLNKIEQNTIYLQNSEKQLRSKIDDLSRLNTQLKNQKITDAQKYNQHLNQERTNRLEAIKNAQEGLFRQETEKMMRVHQQSLEEMSQVKKQILIKNNELAREKAQRERLQIAIRKMEDLIQQHTRSTQQKLRQVEVEQSKEITRVTQILQNEKSREIETIRLNFEQKHEKQLQSMEQQYQQHFQNHMNGVVSQHQQQMNQLQSSHLDELDRLHNELSELRLNISQKQSQLRSLSSRNSTLEQNLQHHETIQHELDQIIKQSSNLKVQSEKSINQKSMLKEELVRTMQQVSSLQLALQQKQLQNQQIRQQHHQNSANFQHQFSHSQQQLRQTSGILDQTNSQLRQLKTNYDQLHEQYKNNKEAKTALQKQIKKLNENSIILHSEVENLRKQNSNLKNQISTHLTEIASLKASSQQAFRIHQQLVDSSNDSQNQCIVLQTTVARLQKQMMEQTKQSNKLKQLKLQLERRISEEESATKQLSEKLNKDNAILKQQLTSTQQNTNLTQLQNQQQTSRLTQQLNKMQQIHILLKKQLQETLESNNQKMMIVQQQLSQTLQNNQIQMKKSQEEIEKMHIESLNLQQQAGNLSQQVGHLEQQKAFLHQSIIKIKEQGIHVQEQLGKAQEQSAQLRRQLMLLQQNSLMHQQQVDKTQSETENIRQQYEKLQILSHNIEQQLQKSHSQKAFLQHQLVKSKQQSLQLQQELSRIQNQSNIVRQEMNKFQQQAIIFEQQAANSQNQANNIKQQYAILQNESIKMRNQATKLQNDANKFKNQATNLQQNTINTTKQLEKIHQSYNTLQLEHQKSLSQLSALSAINQQLQLSHEQLTSRLEQLQSLSTELRSVNRTLVQQNQQSKSKFNEGREAIYRLQTMFRQVQTEQLNKIAELQSFLETMKRNETLLLARLEQLQAEISNKEQLLRLKEEQEQRHLNHITQLESVIETAAMGSKQSEQQLREHIAGLEQEIQQMHQNSKKQQHNEIEILRQNEHKFQHSFQQLQSKFAQSSRQNEDYQQQINIILPKIKQLEIDNNNLHVSLQQKISNCRQLEEQIGKVNKKIQELHLIYENEKKQLIEKTEQERTHQISNYQNQYEMVVQRLKNSQRLVMELEKENDEIREKMQQTRHDDMAVHGGGLQMKMQQEIDNLRYQLAQSREECEDLHKKLVNEQEETKIHETMRERDTLREQLVKTQQQCMNLRQKLNQVQDQLVESSRLVSTLTSKLESFEISQLQESTVKNHIRQMHQKLLVSARDLTEARMQIDHLKKEKQNVTDQLQKSNNKLDSSYQEFEQIASEKEKMLQKIGQTEQLGQEIQNLHNHLEQQSREVDYLRHENERLKGMVSQLDHMVKQIDNLRNQSDKIQQMYHEISELRHQNQEMSSLLGMRQNQLQEFQIQHQKLNHVIQQERQEISQLIEMLKLKDRQIEQFNNLGRNASGSNDLSLSNSQADRALQASYVAPLHVQQISPFRNESLRRWTAQFGTEELQQMLSNGANNGVQVSESSGDSIVGELQNIPATVKKISSSEVIPQQPSFGTIKYTHSEMINLEQPAASNQRFSSTSIINNSKAKLITMEEHEAIVNGLQNRLNEEIAKVMRFTEETQMLRQDLDKAWLHAQKNSHLENIIKDMQNQINSLRMTKLTNHPALKEVTSIRDLPRFSQEQSIHNLQSGQAVHISVKELEEQIGRLKAQLSSRRVGTSMTFNPVENQQSQSQKKIHEQAYESLQLSHKNLEKQLQQTRKHLRQMHQRVVDKEMSTNQDEGRLKQEIQRLVGELQRKTAHIAQLQAIIRRLTEENDSLRRQHDKQMNSMLQIQREKSQKIHNELEGTRHQYQMLMLDHRLKTESLINYERQVNRLRHDMQNIREQQQHNASQSERRKIMNLEQDNLTMKLQLEMKLSEVNSLRDRLNQNYSLSDQLNSLRDQVNQLSHKNRELEWANQDLKKDAERVQWRSHDTTNDNSLQQSLYNLRNNLTEKQRELMNLRDQMNMARRNLDLEKSQWADQVKALKQIGLDLEKQNSELLQKNQQLEDRLRLSQSDSIKKQRQSNDGNPRSEQFKKQLDDILNEMQNKGMTAVLKKRMSEGADTMREELQPKKPRILGKKEQQYFQNPFDDFSELTEARHKSITPTNKNTFSFMNLQHEQISSQSQMTPINPFNVHVPHKPSTAHTPLQNGPGTLEAKNKPQLGIKSHQVINMQVDAMRPPLSNRGASQKGSRVVVGRLSEDPSQLKKEGSLSGSQNNIQFIRVTELTRQKLDGSSNSIASPQNGQVVSPRNSQGPTHFVKRSVILGKQGSVNGSNRQLHPDSNPILSTATERKITTARSLMPEAIDTPYFTKGSTTSIKQQVAPRQHSQSPSHSTPNILQILNSESGLTSKVQAGSQQNIHVAQLQQKTQQIKQTQQIQKISTQQLTPALQPQVQAANQTSNNQMTPINQIRQSQASVKSQSFKTLGVIQQGMPSHASLGIQQIASQSTFGQPVATLSSIAQTNNILQPPTIINIPAADESKRTSRFITEQHVQATVSQPPTIIVKQQPLSSEVDFSITASRSSSQSSLPGMNVLQQHYDPNSGKDCCQVQDCCPQSN